MKSLTRMFVMAALLVTTPCFGQEPPKPPEPEEMISKTLAGARKRATSLDGYVMIVVVDVDAKGIRKGELPLVGGIMRELENNFAVVMGTMQELDGEAKGKLDKAEVSRGPAIVFLDPANGEIMDVTKGEMMPLQVMELMQSIARGESQTAMAKEAEKNDTPELRLKIANARLRGEQYEEARKDFEAAAKSTEARTQIGASIGLALLDLMEKKPEAALKKAESAIANLDENKERNEFNSPFALALYVKAKACYDMKRYEESAEAARSLRNMWPMSPWMHKMYNQGIDMGWDWFEGKEAAKIEEEPK